jgi:hypothetical protein
MLGTGFTGESTMFKNAVIGLSFAAALLITVDAGAALPLAPAGLSTTAEYGLTPVQGCPRGYDFNPRTGRCYPNRRDSRGNYRGDYYREDYRGYRGPAYGGPGYGCPFGTNPLPNGQCVPAGGAWCPRGYNSIEGRCYPNQ